MGSDIFDLIVILLLVFFALRGLSHGFIAGIAGIVALIGGFICANAYQAKLAPLLTFIATPSMRTITAYVLIFIGVMLAVSLVARILQKLLDLSFARWIDTLAGLLLGLAKGLLLCSLAIIIVQTLFADAPFLQNSRTLPYLQAFIERLKEWMPADIISKIGFHA